MVAGILVLVFGPRLFVDGTVGLARRPGLSPHVAYVLVLVFGSATRHEVEIW